MRASKFEVGEIVNVHHFETGDLIHEKTKVVDKHWFDEYNDWVTP